MERSITVVIVHLNCFLPWYCQYWYWHLTLVEVLSCVCFSDYSSSEAASRFEHVEVEFIATFL